MQGPRLYRFFNYELPDYLPAPMDGWNPDANPWELPPSQAQQLDNFLIRPGKLVMRGPVVVTADLSSEYPLNLAGAAITENGAYLSRKNSSSGQCDPWNVPLLKPASANLASGLTTGLWIVGASTPTPQTFASADVIPGPRWINFDGLYYGLSYDSAGTVRQDAQGTYSVKPYSLMTLAKSPPTSATSATLTWANQAPDGAGTIPWTNVGTGTQPTVTPGAFPNEAECLRVTGLGFTLPSTAAVQGIAISMTLQVNASNGFGAGGATAFLVKGGAMAGTYEGTSGYTYAPSLGNQTFVLTAGSSSDLWGTTLTYADVNAGNFGFEFNNLGNSVFGTSVTYTVLAFTVTVYYTNAAPTLTALANAPHGAFDLIGYQSRIWLLAGIDTPGAGTTHDSITLFFTNPIAAGGGSATADWQDPVAGTTNKIVMDGDATDYGVGLATVRNGLVIFRRASIYLLKGTSTANYALTPIARDVGCVDARSIVETDQGVYFMSQEGLMLTNGVTVANVSGSILHTLRSAIAAEQAAVISGKNGYVTCGRTSHGQIVVSIGTGSATAGSYAPIFTAMLDPYAAKGGAWVRLTSQVWNNDGSQVPGNSYAGQLFDFKAPKRLLAFGDRYITALQDQTIGQSMLDPTSGIYDQLPSGTNPFVSILPIWKTPMPSILTSAKRGFAQAKRYYLDYQFAANNLVPTTGWEFMPLGATNAELDGPVEAPVSTAAPTLVGPVSGVTPVPYEFIKRLNRDWWGELDDMYFMVRWADIARPSQANQAVVEIYGLGIEFQHARERR